MFLKKFWKKIGGLILSGSLAMVAGKSAGSPVSYNRDIRPIFSENCFSCHGTDSASRKAGLRLDRFDAVTNVLDDNAIAIVPGKPDDSELIRRINATDGDQMPPKKIQKNLTPAQKELLKEWIAAGAVYEPHWAFVPPVKAPLPRVENPSWTNNPIDHFILARLEQEKLTPNPEADKRTLIRRVSLDLIGLPPTPAEVEAFVNDPSPRAYEKVVDRLLTSPRWGEHRAHYWLDAARYGDTHGIHFDNYREMWTYRDWVINAFNQNMPFDEFTIENLAGDLLPHATRDQKIGSGFNRCHMSSNEAGLIDEEYLVLYTRDRTETTAQTWLGLTVGCAVCHDHKYDPLTQKDFYSLSAFFNNTTEKAMDGNIKDTPPVIVVPKAEDDERWQQLATELPSAEKNLAAHIDAMRPGYANWLDQPTFTNVQETATVAGAVFHAALDEGHGTEINIEQAGRELSVPLGANTNWQAGAVAQKAYTISGKEPPTFPDTGDFERTNAFSYAAWVWPKSDKTSAFFARMADRDSNFRGWDFFTEGGKPVIHLVHEWPKNTIKIAGQNALAKDRWNFVCITYDGSSQARGVNIYVNGVLQEKNVMNDSLSESIHTPAPFKLGQRDTGSIMENNGLQEVKIFARELKPAEVLALMNPRWQWLAHEPANKRSADETRDLFTHWLEANDREYQKLTEARDGLKKEDRQIRERGTVAYVMNERTNTPEAYVLFRGAYDKREDRVGANTPAFLPPMAADAPHNRLGFARWLLQTNNPLTARVVVNRYWQELFGVGIVKTVGDFGVAGEQPSHPELLDWLAVDFREHGWDVKRIFKLMVMSETYRQSATESAEKLEKDPENRLLAHGPRFRMDAEMIRDSALAASGLLVEKIGGPSVRPYQPSGIWDTVGLPEGNTRIYNQDKGDNLYRRSVYTFWKRQAAPPSMEIFNAPSRESCTVHRDRTDTPLQALVTLNDPQFVEAARHLAQESLENKSDYLDFMSERLLARPLTAPEKQIINTGLADLLNHYQQEPREAEKLLAVGDSKPDAKLDVPTLAAYTMVANELMNLDETLNK